ncbi:MAG: ATP-binding protein [Dehalococcoidia bacterium]|nr:ATP-binding protein [Dehalococcoidia bacterium]
MTTPFTQRQPLGMVVGGSVERGLQVRLEPEIPLESIKVGAFVVVQGTQLTYFGVVTDVSLEAVDPRYRSSPPDVSNPFIAQVVTGAGVYGSLQVTPMLALAVAGQDQPQPAKSVPAPFSRVSTASERDVQLVFGKEDARHFVIGTPLDMETEVCLDMEKLVQRSSGIFGKSGTGKTFLTRLLLIGILQSGAATNLVFDMHSEYGWAGYREDGASVKGLKQLFPSQVAVFTLDEASSRRRGLSPDFVVNIGFDEIEPEDIQALRETLNLSDVAADAAHSLERHFSQRHWLQKFLDVTGDDFSTLADTINVNESALSTLQRRLQRLQRLDFIVEKAPAKGTVVQLLDYLDRGYHVVLEFGRYGDDLTAYILLANLLTRRIHQRYRERKEAAIGDRSQEPKPLVITIEEAHKFLNPQVASQTIFGAIAREMRKYNVTLLVIDQRPGAIDTEVMSQVGTKITCLLDDERDVEAVLAGVSGRRELRNVLARLESQQQALVFGHAVPMPVVVRTREYGSEASYRRLAAPLILSQSKDMPAPAHPELAEGARRQRDVDALFGDPPG